MYCQIVQPRPAQLAAGTTGALTFQLATQSGWPRRAKLSVSPVWAQLVALV